MHVLDAGHFALDEKADEIAAIARDFLGRAATAGGTMQPAEAARLQIEIHDNSPGHTQ